MAKIIFIALALLVALVAGQGIGGVCRPQGCVARGAVCDTSLNLNLAATTRERHCKGDDFCKVTNRTGDITGICTARSDVGGACSTDVNAFQPCEDGLQCINKFCNRGYYPGAKCKVANDCLYTAENGDQTAVCNNGRCAGIAAAGKCRDTLQSCLPPNVCGTDGTCVAAVGAGSACVANAHCQIGTYCNGGTCANRIAAGGACTIGQRSQFNPIDEQCVFRYACVPNAQAGAGAANGTCKEMFTATSGSVCYNTLDCAGGLVCLSAPAGSIYGACGPSVSSSRRACNGTDGADIAAVCAANEGCTCNDNTGAGSCQTAFSVVANKGGKGALNSAAGCVEKCSRTDWNCLAKCEGKICNFYSKLATDTEKTNDLLTCADGDADSQLYPGYVACSTGSFVQFSLIGLVAVVAALLF